MTRRDRLRHQREHPALAGVEEQRLVGVDEELVEREAGRPDVGDEGREAVDAVGDLGRRRSPWVCVLSERERVAEDAGAGSAAGEDVRTKSMASISTRSPSVPWLNLPPAGPSSTSSNGWPWMAAHSPTMSATRRPSWSAVRSIPGRSMAAWMSMRCAHTSRVKPTSSRYFERRPADRAGRTGSAGSASAAACASGP